MKIVDMRGQPCPIPVVHAKKTLAEKETKEIVVLVDNITAVQNLEKMAKGTGCGFSYEKDGGSYSVKIIRNEDSDMVMEKNVQAAAGTKETDFGVSVLITSDCMGKGTEELGKLLAKGFIFSLTQLNPPPRAVIFLNSGVFLTAKGANTVSDLKALEEKGTKIFSCGTCTNYYKLTGALAVGSIVDMMTITDHLSKASGIITL